MDGRCAISRTGAAHLPFYMIYHMRAAGMPVCRHPGLTLCHDIRLADILLCAQWLFMSSRMADIVGHAIINN